MNKYRTIGIIGGQGPVSTADIYMRIIKYYQDKLGVRYIRDYPPIIIYSVPTPDLVKSVEDEKTTYLAVAKVTRQLEKDGADFIIIACNSLQFLIDKLQSLVKIPIVGIVPIVSAYVNKTGYKTVGLLASDTVIKREVYGKHLNNFGIKVILPDQSDQIVAEEIMLNEIGGKSGVEDKRKLKGIISNLQTAGAETVLLACTELPLVIKQKDVEIPLIDCNELYAIEAAKLSSKIQ
ncbi:hypothetical protein A3J20_04975 [Candidatus Gottesmanbacteria bacterium RIFCSPLOWO2_02_FULL_42_29]|uniref:Aspartate racemase n=1 Tax=Candidatus Gottesmanbacteria bacterium RIFCSPLOWO2_01_FULL_42_22 TaxID=1798391 RepID=A0A1F6BH41_9BACT|nr:MAG: hypothetical protein A2781_04400 [Candidatus Gottesmanbacteria bacterium RIFCSPHIGHO2_01_FULL_42_27]OGG20254.1 MAG: hypothetical protein A3E72_02385 [Candidatus Gottesmanbacteria bacterium RIFCSPHIGHO2_12_FULL_43_26]OGG32799.1 MAG: hypothetical protein A3G68_04040 [Candidatus Gottesmanbacteria bacterium RIFCSPLOWO2_12_FULL_42_10]OGG36198.1 MAG: hypothetical protein A2968_02190 [Candidatus Gottesmanbacteria bacterium RIFCSPLOWO2_01_FULL_42_22]OGG38375.1 MAG: hypothetical protein A3J20_04